MPQLHEPQNNSVESPSGTRPQRLVGDARTANRPIPRASDAKRPKRNRFLPRWGGAKPRLPRDLPRRTRERQEKRRLHWGLILILVVTICFGLIMLYSASMTRSLTEVGNTTSYISRQITVTLVGVVIAYFITRIDLELFNKRSFVLIFWLVTMVFLLATLFPQLGGIEKNGHRRWWGFGENLSFQPSEIAKIGVVYILAAYYSTLQKKREAGELVSKTPAKQKWFDGFLEVFLPFIIFGIWWLPIFFQSHISVIIIMVALLGLLMISSGVSFKSLLTGGSMLLVLGLAGILLLSALRPVLGDQFGSRWDHLQQRIMIFTESDDADKDDTWQRDQAELAIGSGGLLGQGIGQGKQKYNYLPEGHNDYIFSNIVEEVGFLGGLLVIVLFVLFLVVGMRIASQAPSLYLYVLAIGATYIIALQAFLSIGVNVETVIPTGISLPFFSYGGSGNLFFLIAVGILLNVSRQRKTRKTVLSLQRGVS